ncbi:MAG TPA: PaeR7I family type II restriction endonuclease [Gemmatimonadaceae bacterium]|nr:PaeR7I family type II restriction endonuclease [Gemmatimonadaceae bacterium]
MPNSTVQFPLSKSDLDTAVRKAVAAYWRARSGQAKRQSQRGGSDTGTRGEVTGGQHLNAFSELIVDVVRLAGFTDSEIRLKSGVELPGYFRPTKKWDIVVVRDGRLCAAIEMKSQVGPSFGNNFNNRSEEAIGSSTDFWVAYREGVLGPHQPWVGYFLLVEESDKSVSPVRMSRAVFEPMPIFNNTSYIDRYAILCQRLVLERNYTAAALLTSPRGISGAFREPTSALSFEHFVRSLFGHLVGVEGSRNA